MCPIQQRPRETKSPYTVTSCHEQMEATVLTFLISDEVVYHNAGGAL